MFIAGLITIATVFGSSGKGNGVTRAGLGALTATETEIGHTPAVRLVVLDEIEVGV